MKSLMRSNAAEKPERISQEIWHLKIESGKRDDGRNKEGGEKKKKKKTRAGRERNYSP